MITSQKGINLIKQFEGVSLTAYKAIKTEQYYTIGYGHYGSDVKYNDKISLIDAEELLKKDLSKFEKYVNKYDKVYGFNQNEFDALVSFTYNCGNGNLDKLLQGGKRTKSQIASIIVLYNKSNGKVLGGLTKRRKAEQKLFLEPINDLRKIANEVIGGKYGNGADRKKKLEDLGYNYKEVQSLVNRILKGE